MNLEIVKKIMPELYAEVKKGNCPFCRKPVSEKSFEGLDPIYLREYHISGICAHCQDETFK